MLFPLLLNPKAEALQHPSNHPSYLAFTFVKVHHTIMQHTSHHSPAASAARKRMCINMSTMSLRCRQQQNSAHKGKICNFLPENRFKTYAKNDDDDNKSTLKGEPHRPCPQSKSATGHRWMRHPGKWEKKDANDKIRNYKIIHVDDVHL